MTHPLPSPLSKPTRLVCGVPIRDTVYIIIILFLLFNIGFLFSEHGGVLGSTDIVQVGLDVANIVLCLIIAFTIWLRLVKLYIGSVGVLIALFLFSFSWELVATFNSKINYISTDDDKSVTSFQFISIVCLIIVQVALLWVLWSYGAVMSQQIEFERAVQSRVELALST